MADCFAPLLSRRHGGLLALFSWFGFFIFVLLRRGVGHHFSLVLWTSPRFFFCCCCRFELGSVIFVLLCRGVGIFLDGTQTKPTKQFWKNPVRYGSWVGDEQDNVLAFGRLPFRDGGSSSRSTRARYLQAVLDEKTRLTAIPQFLAQQGREVQNSFTELSSCFQKIARPSQGSDLVEKNVALKFEWKLATSPLITYVNREPCC